jgi:hypothetical protein
MTFECCICHDTAIVLPGVADPPLPLGWTEHQDGSITCDKHDAGNGESEIDRAIGKADR